MNKILCLIGLTVLFGAVGCQKDDSPSDTPARPHYKVYPEDLAKIESFLQSHYIEVNDLNGNSEVDMGEIVVDSLDATHTVSIWNQTDYPLQYKIVKLYDVDFKVYYLKLDGKGDTEADGKKPSGVDRIRFAYRGFLLDGTEFDYSSDAVYDLTGLVKGWGYIVPEFRAGTSVIGSDGDLINTNYGAGIMFLPSGLGYYSNGSSTIPNYSPLVFYFNLFNTIYLDHDNDKIQSRYEYVIDEEDGTILDTDSDGAPDYADTDDDNDGYMTIDEIKKPTPLQVNQGTSLFYPFNPVADDPSTPSIDESEPKGIPDASGDGTTGTRLRRHLDKNTKPPYTTY
ncbi:hypothetical protein [Flavobacterium sp.]|uniref:FKBP-type peptidyl-prolyl cis-trans isomerase n=1 Tax=Flavobacterium sp. TaxID=239 RepID=UPI0028BDCCE0|nr:hypothetical protein [Flavobacterium sp.]